MGGSSKSSTKRTYQTTNVSQQGEAVAYGQGNTVTVHRADAVTLDNIAAALEAGVENLTDASSEQVRRVLETTGKINADSLDFGRDVLEENASLSENALDKVTSLAKEVQSGAEKGTQQAMDFVSNFTERAQIGNTGEGLRTVMYVAGFAGVALVGMAWASSKGIKA